MDVNCWTMDTSTIVARKLGVAESKREGPVVFL